MLGNLRGSIRNEVFPPRKYPPQKYYYEIKRGRDINLSIVRMQAGKITPKLFLEIVIFICYFL